MLLASWALASRGFAQSPVELSATAGFQGHATIGRWVLLRVTVRNRGPAATGELVVPPQPATDDQEYRLAVDVPPSSRRAFTLYVRYENAVDITVRLDLSSGRRYAVDVPCKPHEFGSRIVLVVSRRAGGLSFIGAVPVPAPVGSGLSAKYDSVVAYVSPDSQTGGLGLPDRVAGYSSVSAVVLRDLSPSSFAPEEQRALQEWVAAGGLLVVLTGPNVAELRDTFIEELAPVRIRGQRVVPDLEGLARRFSGIVSLREALVADTEAKEPEAQIVAEQRGTPLVVRRDHENGTVYFVAVDCTTPPLDNADQLLQRMWGEILEDRAFGDLWEPVALLSSPEVGGLSAEVVRLPIVEWNSFAAFGGFLLCYAVALFVAVQLVLRKADRREWAGHVTLLVIGMFSVAALLLGRSVKVSPCRAYEAAIGHLRPGSSVAWIHGVVGVRSPNRCEATFRSSRMDRTLEYLCAGRRVQGWPVRQERGFAVRGVPIDLWGLAAMRVEGSLQVEGQITPQLVAKDGETVAVTVENGTAHDLRYPFVLTASTAHPANDVPAGATEQVCSVPLQEVQAIHSPLPVAAVGDMLFQHCHAVDRPGASPEERVRRRLLRLLSGEAVGGGSGGFSFRMQAPSRQEGPSLPTEPILGAWVELPSGLAELSPAADARTSQLLLLIDIPVETSLLGTGTITFGRVEPVVDMTAPGIWTDYQSKLVIDSGSHEFAFALPRAPGGRRPVRLGLAVECDQPGLSVEVLNAHTGVWDPVTVAPGRTVRRALEPPEDYVTPPGGWVRVRVWRDVELETRVSCWIDGALGPPGGDQG